MDYSSVLVMISNLMQVNKDESRGGGFRMQRSTRLAALFCLSAIRTFAGRIGRYVCYAPLSVYVGLLLRVQWFLAAVVLACVCIRASMIAILVNVVYYSPDTSPRILDSSLFIHQMKNLI